MKKSDNNSEGERRFHELRFALYALIEQDPQSAIEAARRLTPDKILNARNTNALRAMILTDAGIEANDSSSVDEGIAAFRHLLQSEPSRGDLMYNLANGLAARADCLPYSGPMWYCDTADSRREARRLYRLASHNEAGSLIASQAHTNLGTALKKAYRFIEAYDCYLAALEVDPTNGVALTGAARILLRFANEGTGDRNVLFGVAARHLKTARENPDRIREIAGERGFKHLSELMKTEITGGSLPDLSSATDYQRFVAKHRLALAPTIEGLDLAMSRWDSLRIESITEPINTEHGVPPIFAMFNVLKSDYMAARYLAFMALDGTVVESGKYSDTLDYAIYGIQSSLLTLSQRSCMDLLDKTAVAASEYLTLPGNPKSISFWKRWFVQPNKDTPLAWLPEVSKEIALGNRALIALSEISYDIAEGGFLQKKSSIRNASTHRFTVLHDISSIPSRDCAYIDHYSIGDFENQLIETLQLTRAVLFHFVEMIKLREMRLKNNSLLTMPLSVPDHDWVRGEKDEQDGKLMQ